jgi:hypothetical protein
MESKGCHFMFYWVAEMKVDCRFGSGWFSIYVYFEDCFVAYYFQVKEIYGVVGFRCGVKFYVVMDLIYVFVDGLGLDFCYVIYDQDIINVPRVKCYVLCIK